MEPNPKLTPDTIESQADNFLYLKESVPISGGKNLEFHSGATANLLFHTLNIYGMLGNHGRTYSETKEKIGDVPDEQIKTELLKFREENRNNIVGDFIILDPKTPEELIQVFKTSADESIRLFGEALAKSWEKYKKYWSSQAEQLQQIVRANAQEMPWQEYARKMELMTGASFDTDMHAIAAEALMESAMYVRPNIAIGPVRKNNDVGFVHEGLHLLLKENWAEEESIESLIPITWYDNFWGRNWKGKFEQAVVVSLDQLIRNSHQPIEDYFEGCRVQGLEKFFFGPIKDWYEKKLSEQTEEKLSDIIYKILSSHKKELIDDFVWQDDSLTK